MTTITPVSIWNPGTGGGFIPPNGNPGIVPPWLHAITEPDSPVIPLPGPIVPPGWGECDE